MKMAAPIVSDTFLGRGAIEGLTKRPEEILSQFMEYYTKGRVDSCELPAALSLPEAARTHFRGKEWVHILRPAPPLLHRRARARPVAAAQTYRLFTQLGQYRCLCNFCKYPKKANYCKNDSYLFHFVLSSHFFIRS